MIQRYQIIPKIKEGLQSSPVTAILGPRQCGKTTLARYICDERKGEYFDLEDHEDQARLQNPKMMLSIKKGLIVLDEIQRQPALLEVLRVLADRRASPARFLILGSASPSLIKNASETLAGRVYFVDMGGLSVEDVGQENMKQLWIRGGFPLSYLKETEDASVTWRENFIRTFLERDLPQLGIQIPAVMMRRFWTMIAHYHGQIWSSSEISRSLSISHPTARKYLDILTGGFVIRQLQPWFENAGKRVVKSPKVYIRDSGILHYMLNIPSWHSLQSHPKLGASWEGFAIEQVLEMFGEHDAYFWATHGGAELDLFLLRNGKRIGFEFKYSDSPTMTKSMHIAISDLKLDKLYVVYPGSSNFIMNEKTECIGLADLDTVRNRDLKSRLKRSLKK